MNENGESKEIRYSELTDIETRDDSLEISGYALVFNQPSVTLGGSNGFKEVISRSALEDVDLSDIHLYYQHRSDQILANTKSNTMSLSVTDKGLYFKANMADTTLGKDTYKLIKRGDLTGMSFEMLVQKDSWNLTTQPETRTVEKIGKINEISIISRPAYKQSSVSTRSANFLEECRECRDIGLYRTEEGLKNLQAAKQPLEEVK